MGAPHHSAFTIMSLAASLIPRARTSAEAVFIPMGAIVIALFPFAIFIALTGTNPFEALRLMYKGGFGSSFAWQDTIVRASPLMLAGLCTALPARIGLVIIGGEGAVVLGGLFAAVTPLVLGHVSPNFPPVLVLGLMCIVGMVTGGLWIALAGALKYYRGVNETISSLLLTYIAIALFNHLVEGAWRDPASMNKPSTTPIPLADMIGKIAGSDVHWGPVYGVVCCIVAYIFIQHTTIGFAARIAGGNLRAARVAGLSVGKLVLLVCFLGGAGAGLAGTIEVAAVQGQANATGLIAGYGYAGILVAFMARQSPLGIIPVAVLLGGIRASNGMLQRRLGLPDATVLVFEGILFVIIMASETLYGRFKLFNPSPAAASSPPAGPPATTVPVADGSPPTTSESSPKTEVANV
jgi:simple sugar transport system permease protein